MNICINLEADAQIVSKIMQVINDRQLSSGLMWIMDSRKIGEKLETQFLVIIEELHDFEVEFFRCLKTEHAIWFFEAAQLPFEMFLQSFFYSLVR